MSTIKECQGTPLRTFPMTPPASTAIAVGDLLFNNSGTVALASAQTDQLSEAANQVLFASLFAGVAGDQRIAGQTDTNDMVVVGDGIFDCSCAATTWAVGDLVAPVEQSNGTQLENQKVAKTTDQSKAIGICIKAGTSLTTVRCRLLSRLLRPVTGTGALAADSLQVGGISASDAALDITGLAAAQGGAVTTTGGTSSTAGNAGGAVALVGGQPGATGVGGAVSITGGAGGATSGTGGAATVTGGAGTNGNAVGGAATVTAGAGQGTGAGAVAGLVGGASGAGATGNGGVARVVGGAALSTNGSGGAAQVTGGVATGTGTGGAVTITSGASAGAGGTAGNVVIDCGAATGGTAGVVLIGGTNAGSTKIGTGSELAAVKAINVSGTIAVAVPSITDPDIAKVDVDLSSMTFAPAVGDAVIAIPLEALPTACRLQGAWVSATDTVQVVFGSEGGNVTGANKNFKFLLLDLT